MTTTPTSTTSATYTYRVKVGDLDYPAEFAVEHAAIGFAKGARFVLDNVPYHDSYPVTLTTYANTYDFDTNTDETKVSATREF